MKAWYNMLPQCLTMHYSTGDCGAGHNGNDIDSPEQEWVILTVFLAGSLHLGYYATQILLFRALMAPPSEEAKHDPTSSLRRYFEAAVGEAASFSEFVHGITQEDVEAFWGRRKSIFDGKTAFRGFGNVVIDADLVPNLSRCPAPTRFGGQLHDLFVLSIVQLARSPDHI